jgi:CHASE2 domain-containing sensor protein
MERQDWKHTAKYVCLLSAVFAAAVLGSWKFGAALDNAAYDFMFRQYKPPAWETRSILLAIDEDTLAAYPRDSRAWIRPPLARALRLMSGAQPKVVALDLILADQYQADDSGLAQALCATPNLVLSSQSIRDGRRWEDPRPEFAACAAAVGHVHAQPDRHDGVTRAIPLLKRIGIDRRWAIALEAFRLSRGHNIIESPQDLRVGETVIPVPDRGRLGGYSPEPGEERRLMRVRFLPATMPPIPRVSLVALLHDESLAARFRGKVVFVGVTAVTEVGDRLQTPARPDVQTTGIDINAQAFETLAQGAFITDVGETWVFLFSLGLAIIIGLVFRYLPGWRAYVSAAVLIAAAQVVPYLFFTRGRVFAFAMPASVAWLVTMAAAAHYHLVVRRNWLAEQSKRTQYQQAIHFVTHEMRTPLSSIQGSSELMSRFALNEEKRKQIALLINSESKRLARMVEIFLNVERLSAGQMELKREAIPVKEMVEVCLERVRPLAERK